MTPVIPYSTSGISLIPGCTFETRKTNGSIRCCNIKKSAKRILYTQDCVLPLLTSLRLFPHISSSNPRFRISSATGVDVAVEQADQPETQVSGQDSGQKSESGEESPAKSKQRSRPVRKSDMPPVKDEELVPGATFTGKVRSIQPFGAFIDFGAFTDGLVHVSRLSDGYVKDVSSVVSVGQEVKVKLVEANTETGRIALTMRENEPAGGGDTSRKGSKPGQNQRSNPRKTTKFVKGQDLDGTVKNLTRSGAFISLPEGEEGFLPASEEADEGFGNIMGGGSSLEIGQEVKVRVLRIARGQVTLTMKKDEDSKALDSKLQGKVFTATNPFLVAFRKNQDIASFLDEREKVEDTTEVKVDQESQAKSDGDSSETETTSSLVVEDEKEIISSEPETKTLSSEDTETTSPEPVEDENVPEEITSVTSSTKELDAPVIQEDIIEESQPSEVVENKIEEPVPEVEVNAEIPASEVVDNQIEETAPEIEVDTEIPVENGSVEAPPPSETATKESQPSEVVENKIEEPVPEVEVNAEIPASEVVDNQIEETAPEIEVDADIPVENGSVEAPPPSETATKETLAGEVVENKIEETAPEVEEDAEIPAATPVEDESVVVAAKENGGSSAPPPSETATKATISPALVKQLREETGAGMMDCKKALSETGGDLAKAQEHLRKKGLASADKKSSRATAEGRIGSYVHDSRIGVLIEVNCETDFVSRGEIFKELVNDLAMQVAACPQVQYLTPEDVSEEIVKKEKEIEMQKEDLLSKPEQFRLKIVEGRIKKRLDELALLEQAYIKNDKVVVKDFIKSTIATIGENIKVKRFVRFNLGEGLEKRSQDFAAEVAAQTAAKKVAAPEKDQPPPATEPIETANEAPKVTISAALVKQLREESGAGMMDCKKALSETGGNLEKAQEYLRKKGLSTADKKSSRLAAEGRIGSYIHDSRIGVLIEVNCETDFVGRSEKFKELVEDLAMQVVACPKVEYISIEDIPKDIVKKEKEIEMQREDILSKPESIREKIVDGRVSKRLGELALLEQAYLKDDSVLVKDLVKQTVAAIGENIKVRRFVRFTLGESSESKPEETESS